jgi:hypothetical protein
MIAFYTRFPELAARETRTITLHGRPDIPDGEYGLVEFYCDEPDCDCRRVILRVVSAPPKMHNYATINYGWESLEFYAGWMHGDAETAAGMQGASLEIFGPQSQYSMAFLELVKWALQDEAYVRRLQEHYRLFKEESAARAERRRTRPGWRRAPAKRRR